MAFDNLGFEDEDANATGFPDVWTVSLTANAAEAAGFDDGQTTPPDSPVPFEAYEGGWSTNETYTFAYADPPDLSEISPAIFDSALPSPQGVEDYEEGWSSNQNYLFALASIAAASFDVGTPEPVEDYEEEWSANESFSFVMGSTTAAVFDSGTPEPVEDYEEEWRSNESFDFTMGSTTAAVYDTGVGGGSQAVEDFEEVKGPQVITVVPGTDTVAAFAHGMANGQTVTFENEGGILPGGIQPGTNYFVISVSANDFQISTVSGGSAVDITDNGAGTHRVRPDVATFWTLLMATL